MALFHANTHFQQLVNLLVSLVTHSLILAARDYLNWYVNAGIVIFHRFGGGELAPRILVLPLLNLDEV